MSEFSLSRPKHVVEQFKVSVDFVNLLTAGDSIATQAVTATDVDTTADATSALVTAAAIVGTKIQATIAGGTQGRTYAVKFRATTANGEIFVSDVEVPVR